MFSYCLTNADEKWISYWENIEEIILLGMYWPVIGRLMMLREGWEDVDVY